MKTRPPIVRTLDAHLYSQIAGELRKRLPGKVIIEIDRGMDMKGKSVVTLRCRHPEIAKKTIAEVLGEEYIEPEIGEDLPQPRQWWQRSIDSCMGGGRARDAGDLRKSMYIYAKKFQADTAKVRERIYKKKREMR